MLNLRGIRQKWWDLFDPDLEMTEIEKQLLVQQIKGDSREFGEDCLHSVQSVGFYGDTSCVSLQLLVKAVEQDSEKNLSLEYIVVPILVSGLTYGAVLETYLAGLGKSHGLVLASCVTRYNSRRQDRKNRFRDGNEVKPGVYIPDSELALLRENIDKPVLVVDDISYTSDTLKSVDQELAKAGFTGRYSILAHGTIRESDGLRSPTSYNKFMDGTGAVWF